MATFSYLVSYIVSLIIMIAVAYRFRRHADEPHTFLAMVVPVIIPLAQQAFSVGGEDSPSVLSSESNMQSALTALMLMIVVLSTSYFLGSVLSWAREEEIDKKGKSDDDVARERRRIAEQQSFWPFYVAFIVWGALYGGIATGAYLKNVHWAIFTLVYLFSAPIPMLVVAGTAGAFIQAEMRKRVIRFIAVSSVAILVAMILRVQLEPMFGGVDLELADGPGAASGVSEE